MAVLYNPVAFPAEGLIYPVAPAAGKAWINQPCFQPRGKTNYALIVLLPLFYTPHLNRLECNANNQWCWCVRGPSNTTRTDKEAPCFSTYLVYQSLSDSQYLHWQVCIQRFNRIRLYSDLIWFDYAWVFSSCWPTDLLISSGVLRRISSLLLDPLWLWYSVPA